MNIPRRFGFFALVVIAMLGLGAQAASPTVLAALPSAGLSARIDQLIDQPRYAGARWGIAVVSLDSGRVLYRRNADQLLLPASTAKLYTAAATLDGLDNAYRIPTRLLAAHSPSQGRLRGPLVLYGMGDPSLGSDANTRDWADQLATQLAARGVHEIDGDLVADDTYFSGPAFGAGWEVSDLLSAFAVPSAALSVDENVSTLKLTPASAPAQPAQLSFEPAQTPPPLSGSIRTVAASGTRDVNFYRAPGDSTLYAFGSVPAGGAVENYTLALADPAAQAARQLALALARHGIGLNGGQRVLHWPESSVLDPTRAQILAEVLSPPIDELLKRGLKRSQNLYLQNLLQLVGLKAQAEPQHLADENRLPEGYLSSAEWGLRAIRLLLQRAGIPAGAVQLSEGTGLSRRDLSTPDALVRLLGYVAGRPYAQALRDDLPMAGVDGSLQHRLRDSLAVGRLQAKTGSMSYVHCLAGYVTTAAGERLAFAIMLNNDVPAPQAPSPNQDIDAIALLLAGLNQRE
jgi:D-alanyl-D-alanine carboxypeptidase/D-alanyl-D-alanine-endopeptidase (penicillin-binding protein 4)